MFMTINVSIKNVPEGLVDRLRLRAKRHHRSLQGELMAILEEAAGPTPLTLEQAESRLAELGLKTRDDSVSWLRELRDAR
jgi:plasmid stability protein